ncbi:hypothetical protein [Rhodococcus sp. 1163]|nr:hypothetical protein [Rhodococcus sp. 1163]
MKHQLFDELSYEMNKAVNDQEQARIEALADDVWSRDTSGGSRQSN